MLGATIFDILYPLEPTTFLERGDARLTLVLCMLEWASIAVAVIVPTEPSAARQRHSGRVIL